MSWSINLSGDLDTVLCELSTASNLIRTTIDACEDLTTENVTVSISGNSYQGTNTAGSGGSFSVSGYNPSEVQELAPQTTDVEVAAQAVA